MPGWCCRGHSRTAPCPELSPYLRAGFPHGWPEAGAGTSAQAAFARVVTGRDELWQTDETARIQTLRMLGLPTDREAWCELAKRPRRAGYSAADLIALQRQMAVRARPALYLREGIDRIHPDLLRRLFENLLDAYEQAATDGEIERYRLTIESDARVVLTVDGPAFSAENQPYSIEGWPEGGSSEFTRVFTEPHMSHSGRTDAMVQLNIVAAFCSTIAAQTWYAGHSYAQSFADMAAVEPVQSTGFADGTGYRAVLELDTEWLIRRGSAAWVRQPPRRDRPAPSRIGRVLAIIKRAADGASASCEPDDGLTRAR